MKVRLFLTALAVGVLGCQLSIAQAPAGAPAGATGQCNDSTYSTAATKKGACRGHKGVKQWFSADAAAPAPTPAAAPAAAAPAPKAAPAPAAAAPAATAPAPAATPAPAKASKAATAASTTPAPGGGPGMVWVNTASNVYHCPGTKYYGTTKAGKYLSEADAKAAGAHADHGKACTQ